MSMRSNMRSLSDSLSRPRSSNARWRTVLAFTTDSPVTSESTDLRTRSKAPLRVRRSPLLPTAVSAGRGLMPSGSRPLSPIMGRAASLAGRAGVCVSAAGEAAGAVDGVGVGAAVTGFSGVTGVAAAAVVSRSPLSRPRRPRPRRPRLSSRSRSGSRTASVGVPTGDAS